MDIKILSDKFKFKYRVSAIFIHDNKILVNNYDEDSYCLPGGYVEIGETSEEAMLRELKEEINLNFKIEKFAGIIENFFTNLKGQKTHGIDFYYYVKLVDDNDYQFIDYNRVENDKGFIVKHKFSWIDINKLNDVKLLPLEVRKKINKAELNFHIITNKS